jgi:capsular polysaccharide biosynthesis protein
MTTAPRPVRPPELEEEQEIDLASGWQRIKNRWWLPVAGLAAGALVGLVLALAGGDVWRAETIVYVGQPFAPLGGGQIQTLATNPRTVEEIVRSESVVKAAARESGVTPAQLRSSISTKELREVGQPRGVTSLIEIGVKASGPRKAEVAANALAQRVVDDVSFFVIEKVKLLENQVRISQSQLDAIEGRIESAQRQQDRVIRDESISVTLRLLLSANLNSVITTADARRASLQDQLYSARQLLNLAANVERSRVVEPASAVKTTARSNRTSLLVGALIGLLLGVVAALAAEPIIARRRVSEHRP